MQHESVMKQAQSAFDQGNMLMGEGKYEKALAKYEQALEIYPNFQDAEHNRKVALRKLGREAIDEEEISLYAKTLGIEPTPVKVRFSESVMN